MRAVRHRLVGTGSLLFAALLTSCASSVAGIPMAIHDPLALIDDVEGPLRLFVLPAASFGCEATTGMVSPEVPDVAEGMFADAVADLSLSVSGSSASAMLTVEAGAYTVLVRGKGTDPVSGRTDVFIATACGSTTIAAGETREVALTLIPILGMGECGDGVLSPDEQCEDSNTAPGDGCSASCRTEPFVINTTTSGVQNHPSVAGASGRRFFVSFDSENLTTRLRVLGPDGSAVSSPGALLMDEDIDVAVSDVNAGAQLLGAFAQSASGRVALAFVDFNGGQSDIRTVFFNQDRAPMGATSLVLAGMGNAPAAAFAGEAMMVVFEDSASASGLSGQVFAAASTTPLSATPFVVGAGTGSAPQVAGASDHFAVAYTSGGDVFVQRFETDGTARDATPITVADDAATQDQPAIAAMSDGRLIVAWRDAMADGAGAGIAARPIAADGVLGEPIVVNTTTAGEQSAPRMSAGADTVAVVFASGASVRARLLGGDANPVPNREAPPTTADFELAPAGTEAAVASGGGSDPAHFLTVWSQGTDIHGRLHPLP